MTKIIEISNLCFSYSDGTLALNNMSLGITGGKKTAILGPNGAGKSTLLLHFNGINLPQKGIVKVMGEEINSKSEKWVRSKVGLVFQDPDDQLFSTTVWEDVSFGPRNMNLANQEIASRVEKSLKAVDMLDYKNKFPHHLSYGQKKRVSIAGVLAMDPQVIILDEPVAFLDPRGKDILFEILDSLNQKGTTIVIATHDVDLAAEWADELIIIKDGLTLAHGGNKLLSNEKIVTEAHLRFPIITSLFRRLPELSLPDIPRTVSEAVKVMRQLYKIV